LRILNLKLESSLRLEDLKLFSHGEVAPSNQPAHITHQTCELIASVFTLQGVLCFTSPNTSSRSLAWADLQTTASNTAAHNNHQQSPSNEPQPKHVPRHPLHTDERMPRSAKKKSTQQRRGGPRFAWEEEDEVMALVLTFNNQRVAAAPTLFDIIDEQDKVDYLAPSQVYRVFDANMESIFTSPNNCFQRDRQRLTTTNRLQTNHYQNTYHGILCRDEAVLGLHWERELL
jgi:hypothetical protein